MIKLICPECQRENEPERIYCRDCGARLDRSSLAKVVSKQESPEETQRRLRSMFTHRGVRAQLLFFKVAKLILGACVLAAFVQIIRSPDLPARAESMELPPQINFDIEDALTNRRAQPLHYTEAQVNDYLVRALRKKQEALSMVLKFERAFVNFDENSCRITIERSLFGLSIYTGAAGVISLQNGTLIASSSGGSIGRLPLHPVLMKGANLLFLDLWKALDHEQKLITKMGAIEFHPQTIVITPPQ